MPMRLRACAGSLVMSRSAKKIWPRSTRMRPARRLNRVVLPAPFGPMIARNSPAGTASCTSSTAAMPPKVRRSERASSAWRAICEPAFEELSDAGDSLGHEERNGEDHEAEIEEPVDREVRNRDEQHLVQDRASDRPGEPSPP